MEAAHAAREAGLFCLVDTAGTRRGPFVVTPATAAWWSRPASMCNAHDAQWGQDKARMASPASPIALSESCAAALSACFAQQQVKQRICRSECLLHD